MERIPAGETRGGKEGTEVSSLSDYDVENRFEAVVKENTRITPESSSDEVRHIVLELTDPGFKFEVGNSVGLLVPGPHEFGNPFHLRLYSIASGAAGENGKPSTIALCVKRCFYIDEFSGERVAGIASNYLCDRKPGETVTLTGPFGSAFQMPDDPAANLLMVGMGTGIAPFRAFVKQIYDLKGGWQGKVRLFYGARSGLEMLYLNDKNNDIANYYDQATFKAFEAVSPRPALDAPIALDEAVERNASEVWQMINDSNTFVFVAGLAKASDMLDNALGRIAGSPEKWQRKKAELRAGGRYAELIY
jgi:ferredoxin--NADP+ reductase